MNSLCLRLLIISAASCVYVQAGSGWEMHLNNGRIIVDVTVLEITNDSVHVKDGHKATWLSLDAISILKQKRRGGFIGTGLLTGTVVGGAVGYQTTEAGASEETTEVKQFGMIIGAGIGGIIGGTVGLLVNMDHKIKFYEKTWAEKQSILITLKQLDY